jgi:hypothetical protein
MVIRINKDEFASLKFYEGEIEVNGELRKFEVTLDTNTKDKRKKINFYADGSKFTEIEKTEILMSFNEMLGQQINENIIEE